MRRILMIFVAYLSILTIPAIAQTKNKVTVKVEVEEFDTETFATVTCDQFDNQFKTTKKKITFKDESDIRKICSFTGDFKEIEDQTSINVRGKITFLKCGKETTYCFDSFAVFFCNGKYFKNVPLLHFIGKKIFDDDLRYLDK